MTSPQKPPLTEAAAKPRTATLWTVPLLALWVALGSGLLEGIYQVLRREFRGRATLVSQDAIWMGPVMNLGWFLLPALLLLAWWWWRPAKRSVPVAAGTLLFLGISSLALLNGRIHWAASLLLSAGVANQLGRMISTREEGFLRVVRWSSAACALVVLGLAVALPVRRRHAEAQRMAALSAHPSAAPNVLLLVIDTARWYEFSEADSLSGVTPHLLARSAEGTSFVRAFSAAPWTLPSHATIFTGLWPFETDADWRHPLAREPMTLAERLTKQGWATGGFVANLAYCSREYGLARGFVHYEDFPKSFSEFVASSSIGRRLLASTELRVLVGYNDLPGRRNAAQINAEFLGWVDRIGDQPFFGFLNYFDAHEPYSAPGDELERFGSTAARRPDLWWHTERGAQRPFKEQMPAEEVAAERNAYRGALGYIDRQIDSLLGELDRRGLLDNTMVIVTADHGEQFGEHGMFAHGNSFYPHVLHVPLLLRLPGRIPAGRTVSVPVSLRDIPATVMALVAPSDTMHFPGAPLDEYWTAAAEPAPRSHRLLYASYNREDGKPAWGLHADGYHYMRDPDGKEEIYDAEADPLETRDLIGTPVGDSLLPILRSKHDSVRLAARNASNVRHMAAAP
jgi:arylsulfatase A-like enzyme